MALVRRLSAASAPRTFLYAAGHDEYYPPHHVSALAAALAAARLPHAALHLPLLPHAAEGGEAGAASQLVRAAVTHVLTSA